MDLLQGIKGFRHPFSPPWSLPVVAVAPAASALAKSCSQRDDLGRSAQGATRRRVDGSEGGLGLGCGGGRVGLAKVRD